ncbi:MAG: hypothetical protein Q9212_007093, partial [Teloschistes hypoglaucus]
MRDSLRKAALQEGRSFLKTLSQLAQEDAIQTIQEILDDWLQSDTVSPKSVGIEVLATWVHTRQAELDEAASEHDTCPSGLIHSDKEASDADDNHTKANGVNEAGLLSNKQMVQSETPDRTRKALQSRVSTRSTRITRSIPDSYGQTHQDQPQSVSGTPRRQKGQHNQTFALEKEQERERQIQLRREEEQARAQKQQEQEQRHIQRRQEQEDRRQERQEEQKHRRRQKERGQEERQRRRQKEQEQEERQAQRRDRQEQLRIEKQQEQEDRRRQKEQQQRRRQIEKERELEEQRLQIEREREELEAQKQQLEEQERDEQNTDISEEQERELEEVNRDRADVPDMYTTIELNDQSIAVRAAQSSKTMVDEGASSSSGHSILITHSTPTGPQAPTHQLLTPQTSTVGSYAMAGSPRSRAARTLAGLGRPDTDPDQMMDTPVAPGAPGPQKASDLDAVPSWKSMHPPSPPPPAHNMSEASSADMAVPGRKSWCQKDLDDLDIKVLRFTAESKFEPGVRETIDQILNLPNLKYTSERRRYMFDFMKSLFAPASYWDIRCTVHKLISKRGLRCGEPGMVGVHHSICDDADTPQSFKDFIDRWYKVVEFAQDTSSATMTRITRTTQEMLCYEQWRRIRQIWRGPECFGIDDDSDEADDFDEAEGWKQCGGSFRSQPPPCTPEEHQDLLAFLEKERQRRGTVYVGKKFMAKEARDVRGDSFLRIVLAPRLGLGAFGANGDAKAAGLALATEKSTQKMFDKLWNNTMTRGKAAFTLRKYLGWGALIIVKRS